MGSKRKRHTRSKSSVIPQTALFGFKIQKLDPTPTANLQLPPCRPAPTARHSAWTDYSTIESNVPAAPTALEALEGLKPKREKNWTRRQKHKSAYRLSFGQKSPTQSLLDKKTPQSPNAAVPPTRAANATLLQSATSTTLVTRPVKRWTEEVRPLHSVDSKLLHSVTSTTLAIPPPKTWIQRDILPKSSPEIELQQDDTERSHLFQFNGAPDIAELRSLISPGVRPDHRRTLSPRLRGARPSFETSDPTRFSGLPSARVTPLSKIIHHLQSSTDRDGDEYRGGITSIFKAHSAQKPSSVPTHSSNTDAKEAFKRFADFMGSDSEQSSDDTSDDDTSISNLGVDNENVSARDAPILEAVVLPAKEDLPDTGTEDTMPPEREIPDSQDDASSLDQNLSNCEEGDPTLQAHSPANLQKDDNVTSVADQEEILPATQNGSDIDKDDAYSIDHAVSDSQEDYLPPTVQDLDNRGDIERFSAERYLPNDNDDNRAQDQQEVSQGYDDDLALMEEILPSSDDEDTSMVEEDLSDQGAVKERSSNLEHTPNTEQHEVAGSDCPGLDVISDRSGDDEMEESTPEPSNGRTEEQLACAPELVLQADVEPHSSRDHDYASQGDEAVVYTILPQSDSAEETSKFAPSIEADPASSWPPGIMTLSELALPSIENALLPGYQILSGFRLPGDDLRTEKDIYEGVEIIEGGVFNMTRALPSGKTHFLPVALKPELIPSGFSGCNSTPGVPGRDGNDTEDNASATSSPCPLPERISVASLLSDGEDSRRSSATTVSSTGENVVGLAQNLRTMLRHAKMKVDVGRKDKNFFNMVLSNTPRSGREQVRIVQCCIDKLQEPSRQPEKINSDQLLVQVNFEEERRLMEAATALAILSELATNVTPGRSTQDVAPKANLIERAPFRQPEIEVEQQVAVEMRAAVEETTQIEPETTGIGHDEGAPNLDKDLLRAGIPAHEIFQSLPTIPLDAAAEDTVGAESSESRRSPSAPTLEAINLPNAISTQQLGAESGDEGLPTPDPTPISKKRKMTGLKSKHFTPEKRPRLKKQPATYVHAPKPSATRPVVADLRDDDTQVPQVKTPTKAPPKKATGKKSEYFLPLHLLDRVDLPEPRQGLGRIPAGVSMASVPSINADKFGIIQEKLWKEPFWLLIAVSFLNRTTGRAAVPIFWGLKERYPTPEDLSRANEDELAGAIYTLGLHKIRSRRVIRMATEWINSPPQVGRRHRTLHYPEQNDGRAIPKDTLIEEDGVSCEGCVEIGHLYGTGPYAWDSWRIFCRDVFRGVAKDYNGAGATDPLTFEPEWKRVLPLDKELRATLRWMWLRDGWIWDHETGEKRRATEDEMTRAIDGGMSFEDPQEQKFAEQAAGGVIGIPASTQEADEISESQILWVARGSVEDVETGERNSEIQEVVANGYLENAGTRESSIAAETESSEYCPATDKQQPIKAERPQISSIPTMGAEDNFDESPGYDSPASPATPDYESDEFVYDIESPVHAPDRPKRSRVSSRLASVGAQHATGVSKRQERAGGADGGFGREIGRSGRANEKTKSGTAAVASWARGTRAGIVRRDVEVDEKEEGKDGNVGYESDMSDEIAVAHC